jgi:G3E family GTPase
MPPQKLVYYQILDFGRCATMASEKIIPVTIVTGFLGAGKTSLINRLMDEEGVHRQAVVVNDFGAVKLDADLVSPPGVVKLIHGCVCCSSRHTLQNAIKQLTAITPSLERILIEASGVADPDEIAKALKTPELKTRVAVQMIITIAAAEQILNLKGEMAQLAKAQLAAADWIIVNKIDLVSEGELNRVLGWIRTLVANVPIIPVPHSRVSRMDALRIETFEKESFSGGN